MALADKKILNPIRYHQDNTDVVIAQASAMKELFDQGAEDLRVKLNGVIDELLATTGAQQIGIDPAQGLGNTLADALTKVKNYMELGASGIPAEMIGPNSGDNVQSQLEWIIKQIWNIVLGQIPDGTITMDKLSTTLADLINGHTTQLAQIPSQSETGNIDAGVKYIAHRGLSDVAPENSIPAFIHAGKAGFWGCETDVQRTSDGIWVVMHDTNVDRTTSGTGNVKDMTLAQIKALTIDFGNNVALYPNLRVPTMEEYLQVCKKYNMIPVIEVKSAFLASDYSDLVDIIKKYGFEEKSIVICFDLLILWEIRKYTKKIVLQYLAPISDTSLMHVANMGNAGIDSSADTLTKALIEQAHSQKIKVNAWTVDSYDTARTLIDYGVDMITTNKIINFRF